MYPTPDAERSLQSEDGIFGESLMQVDELVDDYTSPPTPTVTESRICISDEVFQEMCEGLERNVKISDDDARIRRSMNAVWIIVKDALAKDLSMSTLLANQEEFQQNVKQKGEQQFIDLLRDTAEKNSWRDLLENGTSFLSFDPERSDHLLSPDVFLKRNLEDPDQSQWSLSPASVDGAQ